MLSLKVTNKRPVSTKTRNVSKPSMTSPAAKAKQLVVKMMAIVSAEDHLVVGQIVLIEEQEVRVRLYREVSSGVYTPQKRANGDPLTYVATKESVLTTFDSLTPTNRLPGGVAKFLETRH
jgi:hypothetical protein